MVITSTEKTEMPTEVVYIQNHIPVKLRDDLMLNTIEVIWLQVHLPHLKPITVGSVSLPYMESDKILGQIAELTVI
jgi:hypothetical protein